MGYYIDCDQPKGKAQKIIEDFGAIAITQDEAEFFVKENMGAVICVVDNGPFEAAAYCYNLTEFRAFTYAADKRPKTWLYVEDADKVKNATGYTVPAGR